MQEALTRLLSVPGAGYSCVADQTTGHLLADAGRALPLTTHVVDATVACIAFLHAAGMDELDDVMITSRLFHHLVRRVVPGAGPPVLVVLVLDRAVSNLAAARRELATSGLPDMLLTAPPAPEPALPAVATPAAPPAVPETPDPASLPRRADRVSPVALPPAPRRPDHDVAAVAGRRWSSDVGTMRRLLMGLRGRSEPTKTTTDEVRGQ